MVFYPLISTVEKVPAATEQPTAATTNVSAPSAPVIVPRQQTPPRPRPCITPASVSTLSMHFSCR